MTDFNSKLKKKKMRRLLLIALAAVIVIGGIWSLDIGGNDTVTGSEVGITQSSEAGQNAVSDDKGDKGKKNKDAAGKEDKDDKASDEGDGSETAGGNNGNTAEKSGETASSEKSGSGSRDDSGKKSGNKNKGDSKDGKRSGKGEKKLADEDTITVYMTVSCSEAADRLSSNWEKESAKEQVPSSGVILASRTYQVKEGTTAYDLLKQGLNKAGIQFEVSNAAAGNGVYIEGINYLYEMDVNSSSGWVFTINGVSPGAPISGCTLREGDELIVYYTCHR